MRSYAPAMVASAARPRAGTTCENMSTAHVTAAHRARVRASLREARPEEEDAQIVTASCLS